jgi:hypothetical protein
MIPSAVITALGLSVWCVFDVAAQCQARITIDGAATVKVFSSLVNAVTIADKYGQPETITHPVTVFSGLARACDCIRLFAATSLLQHHHRADSASRRDRVKELVIFQVVQYNFMVIFGFEVIKNVRNVALFIH